MQKIKKARGTAFLKVFAQKLLFAFSGYYD